jgi:HKD family nuclease
MASITYTVQRPSEGPAILIACGQLAAATEFQRLTGLYAFASSKGAKLLVACLSKASSSWTSASKRWVISIDGGITEPDALRFLLRLRRAEVLVPDAEEILTRNLRPIHRFHPKTLLLETRDGDFEPTGILVGSANMTCNGLCFGHEHAIAVQLRSAAGRGVPATVLDGVDELETVIKCATPIDLDFVDRYEAIRPVKPRLPEKFEDKRSEMILQERSVLPGPQAAALAAAAHLWVEVEYVVPNRGKEEEGNQIDMQRGTRGFFGFGDKALPRNSPIGSVRILYDTHAASRNLRFGNNSMDKLDLPIPKVEGPSSYSNQTLLFTRESSNSFRLTVGTAGDVAKWKAKSKAAGTLFKMRSGREFGVF